MKDLLSLKIVNSTPGHVVRSLRKNYNLTLDDLAKITGIEATNLSNIENGKVELGWDRASTLAAAFHVSVQSILMPVGYHSPIRKRLEEIGRKASAAIQAKSGFPRTSSDVTRG